MKIQIDEALKGKDLYKFLIEHKSQLILQKKSILKKTDPITAAPEYFYVKGDSVTKAASSEISPDATTVRVKVIANTALWCDSQMDVLLPDCWKRSIKQNKSQIPHIHDHLHESDSDVGDVVDIYSMEMQLSDFGINKSGVTQSLIFETDIRKSYNEKIFNKYKAGKMNQHSIGLQYLKIELAVNDEESEKEHDFWNKYIDQVINREYVEEKGYFWVVPEIKLMENSCVLFGANSLTHTLEVKSDIQTLPSPDIEDDPLPITEGTFDVKSLFTIFNS